MMTTAEAIEHLRVLIESYKTKRKSSLSERDIDAIRIVIGELYGNRRGL